MIPIRDDNPTDAPSHVTIALIALNVLIFVGGVVRPEAARQEAIWRYGFVPSELLDGRDTFHRALREELVQQQPGIAFDPRFGWVIQRGQPSTELIGAATALPASLNLFTCMFMHAGWAHLIGNMLFLWIFGNNIEARLGPLLYLVFYLGTGVIASLSHALVHPALAPLVGASGAISGVLGAYLILYPRARILAVIPIGFYPATVKLPAWIYLGFYLVVQNLFPATFGGVMGGGSVAYMAHIGGFVAGMGLIFLLPRRPPHPLRQPARYDAEDDDADIVL